MCAGVYGGGRSNSQEKEEEEAAGWGPVGRGEMGGKREVCCWSFVHSATTRSLGLLGELQVVEAVYTMQHGRGSWEARCCVCTALILKLLLYTTLYSPDHTSHHQQ